MTEARKDLVWIKRITFILVVSLLVYFILMAVIIPVYRFNIPATVDESGSKNPHKPEKVWQFNDNDSLLNRAVDLKSREAFLLSRLEMAESDSISMAISLKDSSVALVVQGVTIYSAKIKEYKISRVFAKTDPLILAGWLSKSFVVDTHYASIPKTPVLYKKAPKDTIEAMSQLEPDPFKDELNPVYFTLILNRNLILSFEQEGGNEDGDNEGLKLYQKQLRSIEQKRIVKKLGSFTPLDFIPGIKIVIDKNAARVIYRAIPENAFVALQI